MSRTVALSTLRSRVRWRTDTENATDRFPTAEIDDSINEGIAKFHSRVVRSRGQSPFYATTSVTTSAGTETYALPATFLEVQKVYTVIDGIDRVMAPYELVDTDGLESSTSSSDLINARYRLIGSNISFRPVPGGETVVYIAYTPTAVKLTSATDTVDGIDGLEEYIVAWAAKRMAIKDRDDWLCAVLDQEMATALEEIEGLTHTRDAAFPPRMIDVRPMMSRFKRLRLPRP